MTIIASSSYHNNLEFEFLEYSMFLFGSIKVSAQNSYLQQTLYDAFSISLCQIYCISWIV